VRKSRDSLIPAVWAEAVLAKAMLAQGTPGKAERELESVNAIAGKLQGVDVRLKYTIVMARVRAALG
jgi:hypothetical protein